MGSWSTKDELPEYQIQKILSFKFEEFERRSDLLQIKCHRFKHRLLAWLHRQRGDRPFHIFFHKCSQSIASKNRLHMGGAASRWIDSPFEMERSRKIHKQSPCQGKSLWSLSAKTLSGRSFRGLASRISMSAPLIYPSQVHHFPPEKKRGMTRDVGTQSTPIDLSSSSPSPAPTPSIEERSRKMVSEAEAGDSPVSFKPETQVEEKETRERKRNGGERKKQWGMGCYCLSLRGLCTRTQRQKEKHKMRTNNTTFLDHLNA